MSVVLFGFMNLHFEDPVKVLDEIVLHAPVGMLVVDKTTGRIVLANNRAEEILGIEVPLVTLDELRPFLKVVDREGNEVTSGQFATTQARLTGQVVEKTWGIERIDGSKVWVKVSAVPVNGHIVTQLTDITADVVADRVRRQFEANVSHELRTPLALIHGFAELLFSHWEEYTPEQIKHFLGIILSKTNDMTWLVNNVLTIFKIESGATLDFCLTNLSEAVTDTIEAMDVLAQKGKVALTSEVAPGLCIQGNPVELRLMFNNLLTNAVKFSPGKTVHVEAFAEAEEAVVRISDTGIGMSLETMEIIFEPWRQGDGGDTRNFGGTGIGLHVVKTLVDKHNSHIEVASELDKGSVFTVRFPLTNGPAQ